MADETSGDEVVLVRIEAEDARVYLKEVIAWDVTL